MNIPTNSLRPGLTQREAAAILEVDPRTLRKWAARNYGPQPLRDGNQCLYNPADVAAFAAGVVLA